MVLTLLQILINGEYVVKNRIHMQLESKYEDGLIWNDSQKAERSSEERNASRDNCEIISKLELKNIDVFTMCHIKGNLMRSGLGYKKA